MASCAKKTIVDAVFCERARSPISDILDDLLATLEDTERVSPGMVLDAIAIRWLLADMMRGQGMSIGKIVSMETNPWQKVEVFHD